MPMVTFIVKNVTMSDGIDKNESPGNFSKANPLIKRYFLDDNPGIFASPLKMVKLGNSALKMSTCLTVQGF